MLPPLWMVKIGLLLFAMFDFLSKIAPNLEVVIIRFFNQV